MIKEESEFICYICEEKKYIKDIKIFDDKKGSKCKKCAEIGAAIDKGIINLYLEGDLRLKSGTSNILEIVPINE